MQQEKIDQFIRSKGKYFPSAMIPMIKKQLETMDSSKEAALMSTSWKGSTAAFLFSFFLGGLAADRFYLGQTGLGILKFLTGGACGIWTIIDWFTAAGRAKTYNYNKFMRLF